MSRPRRGEEGAATELMVAFPAFFFLLMAVVQFALWLHASHAAAAAAQEGARVARVASAEEGRERAQEFLDALAPSLIAEPRVEARRDGEVARVDVWGQGVSLIPGLRAFSIHQHSEGPSERFRPEAEG